MKRIQRTAAVALTGLLFASGMVSAASATEPTPAATAKPCRDTVRKATKLQVATVTSLTTATTAYTAALATFASHNYSVVADRKAALDAYKVAGRGVYQYVLDLDAMRAEIADLGEQVAAPDLWDDQANAQRAANLEASGDMDSYLASLDADPGRLQEVYERRAVLRTLTRKYAEDVDGVVAGLAHDVGHGLGRRGRVRNLGRGLANHLPALAPGLAVGRRAGQYTLYCDGQVSADFPDPYTFVPLAHFWMCEHPSPRRVLVLGGGAEGLLAEILRHPVEHVVGVHRSHRRVAVPGPL